jgi:DNA polymerase III subunit epsilon
MRSSHPVTPSRAKAIEMARKLLKKNPVYLDTETTGLDNKAEIIELSIVDHEDQVLLEQLIKPRRPIPSDSTRIHGISDQMVQEQPDWKTVWPEIYNLLKDRIIGMYNAEFDLRMFEQTKRLYNIQAAPFKGFDVMKLYAQYNGDWDASRRSYRYIKLVDAGAACGISIPNSHRTTDDTRLTRALTHYIADTSLPGDS